MPDSKAVYAGSFDPITLGHEWLIEQAANDYNEVVVAIAINPGKSYTFSVDQRTKMVFLSTSRFSNVEVVAVGNEYLVDFAARHNAGYILRGIRTQDDWAYELAYREFNSRREPNIQTRFYTPSPELAYISSSFVRALVGPRGWHEVIDRYVSPWVHNEFVWRTFSRLWAKWWQSVGGNSNYGLGVAEDLYEKHREPHRKYHNHIHPTKMLEEYEEYVDLADNPGAVGLAIGSHDVIYDPQALDNEERSAEWIAAHLSKDGIRPSKIDQIYNLIIATKNHQPESTDESLICDLDLAILGQKPEIYDNYVEGIRQEYSMYGYSQFVEGRQKKFLDPMLARNQLYHLDEFVIRYELQARQNLTRERDKYSLSEMQ